MLVSVKLVKGCENAIQRLLASGWLLVRATEEAAEFLYGKRTGRA